MQKISPFLWFDTQAEEAAKFYVKVFPNSKILNVARYPKGSPGLEGKVMTVSFRINGEIFTALNGGPIYKITPAISFVVSCKTQAEVDRYWSKLTSGGKEIQCGWLEDKFGVSWQIVPTVLGQLFAGKDKKSSERVMQAMLKMVKLDINELKKAAKGN